MKLPTKEAIDAARNRIRARQAGMTETEIYRRYPRPAPPLEDRVRSASRAARQALYDFTRHGFESRCSNEIVRKRKSECATCEHYHRGTCNKCGCLIPLKVHLRRSTCPLGRWDQDPVSVIIPARNEKHLGRTIRDVLGTATGPVDVLVFADGWTEHRDELKRVIAMDGPVRVVVNDGDAKGIRHASNVLAQLATGTYLYRIDGHCTFPRGWDVPLKNSAEALTLVVPAMRILEESTWTARRAGSNFYYVTKDYRYRHLPGAKSNVDVVEIMAFIGAAWFMRRDAWMALGGYDERFYHWGESGVEWSLKTWLGGGRVVLDRRTWFGHLFRPKFPYHLNGREVERNRDAIRDYFSAYKGKRSLSWLVRKFKPLPEWHREIIEGTTS